MSGSNAVTEAFPKEAADGAAAAANLQNKYGLPLSSVYPLALQGQDTYSNPRMVRFGLRMGF